MRNTSYIILSAMLCIGSLITQWSLSGTSGCCYQLLCRLMRHRHKAGRLLLLAAYTQYRYHIGGKHYAALIANVAVSNTHFYNLFNGEFICGFGITYGFDSKFGPLEASIGYSNRTEKLNGFFNIGYYF